MKSNYKRIGDYIHKVEERNNDLKVSKLLGLSMTKEFRESTSNIIGTDMSVYKVVRKGQFACDFMSVIRVNKLPVVLKMDDEPILVSPAYPVFEVNDVNELDPEYLMMWFRRSEFDRYAVFKCDSAIRGGYDWTELCNSEFPIPHIDKQKEIVKEYNILINRIGLNNQLIKKLEETAQAIYKQWFVDFEFPDDEGKAYKSNGGEMLECEDYERGIPINWALKPFTKIVKLGGGGTPDTTNKNLWNGDIPFFTPADVTTGYYSIISEKHVTQLGLKNSSTKLYPKNTVFITARGTVGSISMAGCPMTMNQSCYSVIGLNQINQYFVHQLTRAAIGKLKNEATGAVFSALVTKDFDSQILIEPSLKIIMKYGSLVEGIYNLILNITRQNQQINIMVSLILSKLASIKN